MTSFLFRFSSPNFVPPHVTRKDKNNTFFSASGPRHAPNPASASPPLPTPALHFRPFPLQPSTTLYFAVPHHEHKIASPPHRLLFAAAHRPPHPARPPQLSPPTKTKNFDFHPIRCLRLPSVFFPSKPIPSNGLTPPTTPAARDGTPPCILSSGAFLPPPVSVVVNFGKPIPPSLSQSLTPTVTRFRRGQLALSSNHVPCFSPAALRPSFCSTRQTSPSRPGPFVSFAPLFPPPSLCYCIRVSLPPHFFFIFFPNPPPSQQAPSLVIPTFRARSIFLRTPAPFLFLDPAPLPCWPASDTSSHTFLQPRPCFFLSNNLPLPSSSAFFPEEIQNSKGAPFLF